MDGAIITTSQERRVDRFEGPPQVELVAVDGPPNDERVSDRTELVRSVANWPGRSRCRGGRARAAAVSELVLKCTRTIAHGESGEISHKFNEERN